MKLYYWRINDEVDFIISDKEVIKRGVRSQHLTFFLATHFLSGDVYRKYSVNPVIASEVISVVAGSRRLQPAQNLSLRLCAP